MMKKPKDVILTIRITKAEKEAADKAAAADKRTTSDFLRLKIEEALKKEGYLA